MPASGIQVDPAIGGAAACVTALSLLQNARGHSSVGRAPALQAGCQGFESPYLQFAPLSKPVTEAPEGGRLTSARQNYRFAGTPQGGWPGELQQFCGKHNFQE